MQCTRLTRCAGQATVEYLVALLFGAVVLFLPWQGGGTLARQLQQAVSEFLEASILALSLV